jgi:hypothetical protein
MSARVKIRELAAWDLDLYPWRDQMFDPVTLAERTTRAAARIAGQIAALDASALLAAETLQHAEMLQSQRLHPELHQEMNGLDWSLGVVDLRRLIAFQRRLVLDPEVPPRPVPQPGDWPSLCALAFAGERSLQHHVCSFASNEDGVALRLHSSNPDLRIAPTAPFTGNSLPFVLTGGSPFFEVAEFRGRWFLRDGYHRAFQMLGAGVTVGFAVVVRARTIEELGAVDPWFFNEQTLFSTRPPMVTDFLEDHLVITYERPRFRKTISIQITESLEPFELATDTVTATPGGTQ